MKSRGLSLFKYFLVNSDNFRSFFFFFVSFSVLIAKEVHREKDWSRNAAWT